MLIGRKTFQQIDSWGDPYLYASKRNIVFSRTLRQEALAMRQRQGVEVELEAGDPVEAVRALKSAPGAGRIWLVGGSELAAPLLSAGLVEEMVGAAQVACKPRTHWKCCARLESVPPQRADTGVCARLFR